MKTGRNKVKREILSLMRESSIHGRHTLINMSPLVIYQYRFVSLHHHPCRASSINEALSSVTSVNEVKEKITSDQEQCLGNISATIIFQANWQKGKHRRSFNPHFFLLQGSQVLEHHSRHEFDLKKKNICNLRQ